MRKSISKKALLALPMGLLFVSCLKPSIGYVDSSRLVKESARFQSARDSLTAYNQKWQREAQALDSLVKDLAGKITAQGRKGPALDSLITQYNGKQNDLQRFVQASSERARKLEVDLMAPHLKTTNSCLQKFLKEKKLTVLFGTQQAGTILAGDPSADFTEDVIEYLNRTCKD